MIGSYTSSIDTKRNEAGLRSNNSHLGEAVYVESNLFGLVDQARGKEPATFGKVVADIVRTVVRPVEVGASIDRRSRLIENSALVTALSWNAIFDMKTGTVNEAWEGNIAKLVEEFQKSNSLPEGFNKEAFVASMKEKVAYFDSIKSTGDKAQAENVLKLGVMRQTFVNQAAELTASRVDQGAKFDGVSAGLALLVLPFVKFNTSNVAVSRQGVSEASNDIARASASLAR